MRCVETRGVLKRLRGAGMTMASAAAVLLAMARATGADAGESELTSRQAPGTLPIGFECPCFVFVDGEAETRVRSDHEPEVKAPTVSGEVELAFPSIPLAGGGQLEVRLCRHYSSGESVVRKWARFRTSGVGHARLLEEIVFDQIDVDGRWVQGGPDAQQSHPAFVEGAFIGIEFPIAAMRLEGDRIVVASRPGLTVAPDVWYETRRVVCGWTDKGEEKQAFRRYILAHRPPSEGLHVNYNSWWTSPAPYYTETDILDVMQAFDAHLYQAHGVAFDTFCIDMGWSNPKSLWAIDTALFPEGFTRIERAAAAMRARLGLWISPSSRYPPALDNAWAKEAGYEATGGALCLGGERYARAFRERLVEMVTKYGIRHIKLDGYVFHCAEPDHGHAPGEGSAEAVAEGFIAAAQAVHEAAPDTWLEATCFGYNPSPWWLFHVNSVIGTFGDDAPFGRVPAPVYRESYTTARDYYNLQGAYWNSAPDAGQEVLGVIHQTPEPFLNDAVVTVMRGHRFLPLYVNPEYMDEGRWRSLAEVVTWARRNVPAFERTEPLLPRSWQDGACPRSNGQPMPREPYGYAHWGRGGGMVVLRNPWAAPQRYALSLPEFEQGACLAVSLYPEPRLYADHLGPGGTLETPLAPYETVVLAISTQQPACDLPSVTEAIRRHLEATTARVDVGRVEFEGEEGPYGPDWTSLVGDAARAVQVTLDADVTVSSPRADLLVLLEGVGASPTAEVSVHLDGKPAMPAVIRSDTGWAAAGGKRPECWTFHRVALKEGENRVRVVLFAEEGGATASVWVWGHRAGRRAADPYPNALPEPELVSLDGVALLEPTVLARVGGETARVPRPVERINGVYLDALEPVSVTQGWGVLQRNQSVWEKPMTIAGRLFRRGLGTHAPSRIVYALPEEYARFEAWAGADGATRSTIAFEVRVDGETRWASGPMARDDPPQRVDLEVSGARTLELLVHDGGNGIEADHADWADARLLR